MTITRSVISSLNWVDFKYTKKKKFKNLLFSILYKWFVIYDDLTKYA